MQSFIFYKVKKKCVLNWQKLDKLNASYYVPVKIYEIKWQKSCSQDFA